MIKTILFDLDDTILDFHKAEATAVCKTLEQLGVCSDEKTALRYSEINACMWKLLEKGELTREQVLVKRFEKLFDELGVERSATKTKNIYENNLSVGHYFIDGAYELLKALHKDYNLYLASNGTLPVQQGRIKSAKISKFFKDIFISEEIGFVKPQKEFFDECFNRISEFNKDETIIIGDSLSSDIKGGKNAGIKTCWFNPKKHKNDTNILADYEIYNLDELIALLKSI